MAMIEVDRAQFAYRGQERPAVAGVSLTVEAGSWLALIGHNGSGKSTLARLIDGLLPLGSGTITVAGLPVTEAHLAKLHQQVAFVFQNPDNQFVGATVADDVAFGLENQRVPRKEMEERVAGALELVGMTTFADREPAQLSGGQKQRVALAGALALQPTVLIVDEATAMLDPEGKDQVMALLKQLRAKGDLTILSITHDAEEAALADQVALMDGGRLITAGTPAAILEDADLMRAHQLAPTFATRLKEALKQRGLELPKNVRTDDQMVTELWQQLNSRA